MLAAGTLGSTQILLRSRDLGLPVSDRLGHGFSGNGDVLAFAYDTDEPVRDVGLGDRVPRADTAVGPTITGLIDLRGPDTGLEDALIIEDGAIPGALASVIPLVLSAASDGVPEGAAKRLRGLAGIPFGSHHGPVGRTLTYLVMSTDDAGGRIAMENDRIQVVWPECGQQPAFARDNRLLAEATRALQGIGDSRPALGLDARPVADHRASARRVRDGGRRGRRAWWTTRAGCSTRSAAASMTGCTSATARSSRARSTRTRRSPSPPSPSGRRRC